MADGTHFKRNLWIGRILSGLAVAFVIPRTIAVFIWLGLYLRDSRVKVLISK